MFPDISEFEPEENCQEEEEENDISEWAYGSIRRFQIEIEELKRRKKKNRKKWDKKLLPYEVISVANEVFGYDGWSSTIGSLEKVQEDIQEDAGVYVVRFSSLARITLKDGTHSEELGFGEAREFEDKGLCFFKAKRMAISYSQKNALLGLQTLID